MYDQAELDKLYWQTKTPVAELAERFGLAKSQVPRRVTPFEAGVACLACRAPLSFRSRSELAYGSVTCKPCGASRPARPSWVTRDGIELPTEGVVLVVDDHGARPWERWALDAAVAALHRAGFGWDERQLVNSVSFPPDTPALIATLLAAGARVAAMHSPDVVALTQDEFVATVFALREGGCRVVCAQSWARWGRSERWDVPIDSFDEPELVAAGPLRLVPAVSS